MNDIATGEVTTTVHSSRQEISYLKNHSLVNTQLEKETTLLGFKSTVIFKFDQEHDQIIVTLSPCLPTQITSPIIVHCHHSSSQKHSSIPRPNLSLNNLISSSSLLPCTTPEFDPHLSSLSCFPFSLSFMSKPVSSFLPSFLVAPPSHTPPSSSSPPPSTPKYLSSLTPSPSIEDPINKSTFSGAMDIIVVQHPNGERTATPFHVRFGRFKLLRPDGRLILLLFNGQPPLHIAMYMDTEGIGRFKDGNDVCLTSEQLQSLPLHFGANRVTYTTLDKKQQPVHLHATLYLWHHTTKCVVSDIDGTITKSDALGFLLPTLFGHSYAHPGVTRLYQKIHQAGYQFIYLTARGIGHSLGTKKYLTQLVQSECTLPEGPLLVSPDSFLTCMKREWDRTTAHFKAHVLVSIASVFQKNGNDIFKGGFGNRVSDLEAYTVAGIPVSHQFLVESSGRVEVATSHRVQRSASLQSDPFGKPPGLVRRVSRFRFKKENQPSTMENPELPLVSYETLLEQISSWFPAISNE